MSRVTFAHFELPVTKLDFLESTSELNNPLISTFYLLHQNIIDYAQIEWFNIREQLMINLAMTTPHRVQAVIEVDGWYAKY
jgi:hypothetical protein